MCCNMRILNSTFTPRTRAVTSTWRDMAGDSLQFRGCCIHLPTHPTGAHRGAHHEILAGELRWVGRAKTVKEKGPGGRRRRKKGRRKFHVRVGNLNKHTVRARFKNGLVSRKRNGGPNYARSAKLFRERGRVT